MGGEVNRSCRVPEIVGHRDSSTARTPMIMTESVVIDLVERGGAAAKTE
jgi:hypothetical protein